MKEGIEELRLNFEANTDIQINEQTTNWKPYAIWLEGIKIKKFNNEIIRENNKLRAAFYETIDILESALSAPI